MDDPRFSAMIISLASTVFLITLNGHLRGNMVQAVFGFLGLAWAVVSIAIFIAFGWKIGVLCLVGSYFFGMLVTPISGIIVGFLRGEFGRKQLRNLLPLQFWIWHKLLSGLFQSPTLLLHMPEFRLPQNFQD